MSITDRQERRVGDRKSVAVEHLDPEIVALRVSAPAVAEVASVSHARASRAGRSPPVGREVFRERTPDRDMAGLRYDGGDAEYVYVLVERGEWQFIATSS